MITLLVMTDGRRECLERTIVAARTRLKGPISRCVIHDDSDDDNYRAWLTQRFPPPWEIIGGDHRRGFAGAIAASWAYLRLSAWASTPYVFHLEDDFVIERDVPLPSMMDVLRAYPHMAQLALLRDPVNAVERAAGGIIAQHPESYERFDWRGLSWIAHRRFFTTNPSLYRSELMDRGWPVGPESEGRFGIDLFTEPKAHVAFWGDGSEWCTHIGQARAGTGY